MKLNRSSAVFIALGFELTGLIAASLYLGSVLDRYFNFQGVFVLGLSVLALSLWIFQVLLLAGKSKK